MVQRSVCCSWEGFGVCCVGLSCCEREGLVAVVGGIAFDLEELVDKLLKGKSGVAAGLNLEIGASGGNTG